MLSVVTLENLSSEPRGVGYPAQRERMPDLDVALDAQSLLRLSRKQSFVVRKAILEKPLDPIKINMMDIFILPTE